MTRPVISLRPHTTVGKAAELLVTHGFGAAPVRSAEGEVLGIATEADLMRDQVAPGAAASQGAERTVAAVMTPAPLCVSPDEEISEVALQMLRTGDRSVLVMDRGRLVGIVTSRDVLRAVACRGVTARRSGSADRRPAELLLMRGADSADA